MNTIAQLLRNVDPFPPARSLYVHIPFCFHKCHYCDFYSLVDSQDRQSLFTDRLIDELTALAPFSDRADPNPTADALAGTGPPGLRTIFVGGGTPTLLAPEHWDRLLGAIASDYALADDLEFTVEANPETVSDALVATLAAGGVNRVSIGCQTFNATHLKTLERWHDPDNVPRAIERIRRGGISRISLDLIFGIPGQSLGDWADDLERAIALEPEHLSCYALTFEPGTAMTTRRDRGHITPIEEDLEADMFLLTRERLREAGYVDYEISNFARPGAACRHNLVYWENGNWLAAGPSASGHMNGLRWKVLPHLAKYLASQGSSPLLEFERVPPATQIGERIMLGLRLTAGMDLHDLRRDIAARLSPETLAAFEEALNHAIDNGELEVLGPMPPAWQAIGPNDSNPAGSDVGLNGLNGLRLRLTEAGRLVADTVIARFMAAVDPPTRHPLAQIAGS